MEGIINRILEIDKLAEQKIAAAKKLKQQTEKEAYEECAAMEERMKKSADRAIENVEAVNKLESEMESEKIERKYADEIKRLDRFYEEKHAEIESLIFSQIIGEIS